MDIDHRRGASFAPGELSAYLRSTWDFTPEATLHIEAVHGLNNLGAVVTHVAHATSPDGFAAEWRVINLLTVEGDLISRCEVFDEADLDAALARFDELSAPVSRLNNAASRAYERFWTSFAARDWDCLCGSVGRRHRHARSPSGRERWNPARPRCRNRGQAGRSPTSVSRL